MILFILSIVLLSFIYYFYKVAFGDIHNPLGVPKPLALAIVIVGFLVLPPPAKAMLVIMLVLSVLFMFAGEKRVA